MREEYHDDGRTVSVRAETPHEHRLVGKAAAWQVYRRGIAFIDAAVEQRTMTEQQAAQARRMLLGRTRAFISRMSRSDFGLRRGPIKPVKKVTAGRAPRAARASAKRRETSASSSGNDPPGRSTSGPDDEDGPQLIRWSKALTGRRSAGTATIASVDRDLILKIWGATARPAIIRGRGLPVFGQISLCIEKQRPHAAKRGALRIGTPIPPEFANQWDWAITNDDVTAKCGNGEGVSVCMHRSALKIKGPSGVRGTQ